MKTIKVITVLLAIFSLHIQSLMAFTGSDETGTTTSVVVLDNSRLAPVTPFEADFSDGAPEMDQTILKLQPVTPTVAEFEDVLLQEVTPDIAALSPVTPVEAAFEDIF